jgi:hypothetical protein
MTKLKTMRRKKGGAPKSTSTPVASKKENKQETFNGIVQIVRTKKRGEEEILIQAEVGYVKADGTLASTAIPAAHLSPSLEDSISIGNVVEFELNSQNQGVNVQVVAESNPITSTLTGFLEKTSDKSAIMMSTEEVEMELLKAGGLEEDADINQLIQEGINPDPENYYFAGADPTVGFFVYLPFEDEEEEESE